MTPDTLSSAPFSLVAFLLAVGLIARITRLIVDDTILQPAHHRLDVWLAQRNHDKPKAALTRAARWFSELVNCGWCTSVWISAAVFGSLALWGDQRWWFYIAAAATASYFAGLAGMVVALIAGHIPDEDDDEETEPIEPA